jgi:hypothetical protein
MKQLVLISSLILVGFFSWTVTAQEETRRGEEPQPYVLVDASSAEVLEWLANPPALPTGHCPRENPDCHCPEGSGGGCSCTDVKDCIKLIESNQCGDDFDCAPTPHGPVCVCTAK